MSASLVGSEMCIRDRPEPPHHRVGFASSVLRPCRPSLLRAEGRVLAGAVSYTHLTLPTICSV
eukprot:7784032-Alexandrium_andersonii.AAC.1